MLHHFCRFGLRRDAFFRLCLYNILQSSTPCALMSDARFSLKSLFRVSLSSHTRFSFLPMYANSYTRRSGSRKASYLPSSVTHLAPVRRTRIQLISRWRRHFSLRTSSMATLESGRVSRVSSGDPGDFSVDTPADTVTTPGTNAVAPLAVAAVNLVLVHTVVRA